MSTLNVEPNLEYCWILYFGMLEQYMLAQHLLVFYCWQKKGKLKITNSTSGAWKKQMKKKCSSGAHGVGQCTWLFSSYRALDKCPLSFSKHWFYTENPCWMILTAVFVNMTYLLSRYFSLRHSYSWIVCIWFRILHV